MSWFKKAATDDGGLNLSQVPPFVFPLQITRKDKTNVRKKKRSKNKKRRHNS